jgi:hypothetical protein
MVPKPPTERRLKERSHRSIDRNPAALRNELRYQLLVCADELKLLNTDNLNADHPSKPPAQAVSPH